MMHWGWGAGWGWFGMIWMVVFWVGIIALAVWLVGAVNRRTEPRGARAAEILDERYARGEITREQWQELKADLTGTRPKV